MIALKGQSFSRATAKISTTEDTESHRGIAQISSVFPCALCGESITSIKLRYPPHNNNRVACNK